MHVSGAADAPAFGHFFGDESAAHGPFAADTNSREETENGKLPDAGDEGTEQSERGIPEDGEHQGSDAAEFIADGTPEEGAAPAEQEQREEQAAVITNVSFGGGEAGTRKEFAEGWNEDEGVNDGVHAVESPAAPGGPESADLIGGEWAFGVARLGIFLRTKDTPGSWRMSMMGLLVVGDRVRERRLRCDADS